MEILEMFDQKLLTEAIDKAVAALDVRRAKMYKLVGSLSQISIENSIESRNQKIMAEIEKYNNNRYQLQDYQGGKAVNVT